MSYNVVNTDLFSKELKRLVKKFPSLKEEMLNLINELEHHPQKGTSLGNNCYKIRLAIASKGKGTRGGARVITFVYMRGQTVYLTSIYDKSEQGDINKKELNSILHKAGLQ